MQRNIYFLQRLETAAKNKDKLFKLTRHLIGNTRHVTFVTSAEQLANPFCDFYMTKVASIQSNINIADPSDIGKTVLDDDFKFDGILLEKFLPTAHDEVKRIITNVPNKSCDLDPIPT